MVMVAILASILAVSITAPPPNFRGLAYAAVNVSAQHNLILLPTVSAEIITGHSLKNGTWIQPNVSGGVARMMESVMSMPVGLRAVRAWNLYSNETRDPRDNLLSPSTSCHPSHFSGLWWKHGALQVAELHETMIAAYKAVGGELDIWVVDDEDSGSMHSWHIGEKANDPCTKERWDAIQQDARFSTLQNLLTALGFFEGKSPEQIMEEGGSSWLHWWMTLHPGHINLGRVRAWTTAATQYFGEWVQIGQIAPVKRHFPKAIFSNYGAEETHPSTCIGDANGFTPCDIPLPPANLTPSGRGLILNGDVQAPPLYMDIRAGFTAFVKAAANVRSYPLTPFNAARAMIQRARGLAINASAPVWPYVSYKSYGRSLADHSEYYQEMILHLGLTGARTFQVWNTHATGDDNPTLSATLDELEAVIGPALGENVSSGLRWEHRQLASWTDRFVLTAAAACNPGSPRANPDSTLCQGHCWWRFTPDLKPGNNPQQFVKLEGGVLQISVPDAAGTVTKVTLAGATVLTVVKPVSASGLWITQRFDEATGACPMSSSTTDTGPGQ